MGAARWLGNLSEDCPKTCRPATTKMQVMSFNPKFDNQPAREYLPGPQNGYSGYSGYGSTMKGAAAGSTCKPLPQFIRDLIASSPRHREGVHRWMFKLARQLHAHRDTDCIIELLAGALDGCGRHVPEREIREAVEAAKKCAWQPGGAHNFAASKPKLKWPEVNEKRRAAVIAETRITLADLFDLSPTRMEGDEPDSDWFVDQLFPGNPLLCIGYSNRVFATRPREKFRGTLGEQALIVPSPMSMPVGIRKSDGRLSAHTLDNTGPRRFLVTEFDKGSPDEQCSIIWHLRDFAPLVMVLSSGGKSLHAWWRCWDAPEDVVQRFFTYAVTLGADPMTWTRSQFVRLPMGWRHDSGRRQEVLFFDHNVLVEGGAA